MDISCIYIDIDLFINIYIYIYQTSVCFRKTENRSLISLVSKQQTVIDVLLFQ